MLDADNGPETFRFAETVDEPVIIAPLPTVNIPVVEALVRVVTPVTLRVPVAIKFAKDKSPEKSALP